MRACLRILMKPQRVNRDSYYHEADSRETTFALGTLLPEFHCNLREISIHFSNTQADRPNDTAYRSFVSDINVKH